MSHSEEEGPGVSGALSDNSDDDGPSTSWGLKRRNKRPVISDSENDDDDEDEDVELVKDDEETGDSDSSEDSAGAKTCAICLGRMRGEVGSPNGCEHTFCKFCILEWAKKNPTCPQDRIPFSTVLVRKELGGQIDKEVPVPKSPGPDVYEFVETENPTYCEVCHQCDREDRLLLCDGCDLGYHLECLDPPLSQVPVEEWFCPICVAVDVPETILRRSSSSAQSARARRLSSRSSRVPNEQQEPRIPRTRATERIREHIQKKKIKKKLKRRRRRKETKKAKIESGELEDLRAPVKQLKEFRYFDGDDDIDADFAEDKYAEQLLAGATNNSVHVQSQRKADAAQRLRYAAFTPQASYFGRAKNKVIEIVNTQSNDAGTDLLDGILENQSIAFSSSKKLVLTNDRKLTKQSDTHVSFDIVQANTYMSEPLPSQKKVQEKSDVDTEGPSENLDSHLSEASKDEKLNESKNRSLSERQKSPSSSSHYHSSKHRDHRKSSCNSYRSVDKYHDKVKNEDGHHSRTNDSHHYSEYSHRRESSWYRNTSSDPAHSSYRSHDRSHSSSRWDSHRNHRDHNSRYERHRHDDSRDRSSHKRSRSPAKFRRQDERGSSSHRSDNRKSHSSHSYKSHSKSRNSSHSSNRSYWSFGYSNSSDNVISRNNTNSVFAQSGKESQGKLNEFECSGNKISDKSVTPTDSSVTSSENLLDDMTYSAKEVSHQTKIASSCDPLSDNMVYIPFEKQTSNTVKNNGNIFDPTESCHDTSDFIQKQIVTDKHIMSNEDVESHSKFNVGKNVSKDNLNKKTKISALFGDLEDEDKSVKKTDHLNDNSILNESKEESMASIYVQKKFTSKLINKSSKLINKSKTKMLFGNDSDSNSGPEEEIHKYKLDESALKDIDDDKKCTSSLSSSDFVRDHGKEYNPVSHIEGSSVKHLFKNEKKETLLEKENVEISVNSSSHNIKASGNSHQDHKFKEGQHSSESKKLQGLLKVDDEKYRTEGKYVHSNITREKEAKLNEKYDSGKESGSHRKHQSNKDETTHDKKYNNKEGLDSCRERGSKDSNSSISCGAGGSEVKNEKLSKRRSEVEADHTKKHDAEKNLVEASHQEDEWKHKEHESKGIDLHHHEKLSKKEKHTHNNKENKEKALQSLKHHSKEKDKSSEKCDKIPEEIKLTDMWNKKENTSHSVTENSSKSHPDLKDKKTESKGEKYSLKSNFSINNNSKNNGVGKKSSKNKLFCDENLKHSPSSKDFGKNKDKKLETTNDKKFRDKGSSSQEKNLKTSQEIVDLFGDINDKFRDKGSCSLGKYPKTSHEIADLFGDIDDIDSSSCSNHLEREKETFTKNGVSKVKVEDPKLEGRPLTFVGKFSEPADNDEDLKKDANSSHLLLDVGLDIHNDADNNGLCQESVPKYDGSSAVCSSNQRSSTSCSNNLRNKQQQMNLEAKVVKEVKKYLDPYYQSKTITRDEYKQIVAKCVKKVVNAECGDIIEPEKIRGLALGYVKVYKHRQMKFSS